MSRLVEGLVAGGLLAGVVWYARRDRQKADTEADTAERVAHLAAARARVAAAIAQADGATAAGNAAAARVPRAPTDGAIAAGSAATARAQIATAISDADRAVAAGNAAAARASLATAIAQADRAIAAGNAAAHTRVTPSPNSIPTAPTSSRTKPARRPAGLTRRFDDLFRLHGRGIPVAYLRALANAESGMNPDHRLGLINVVPIALADYNERHPSAPITAAELRDSAKNITVAAAILRTIIDGYQRNHRDVPNLVEDWSNPHFAGLLSAGWNSGASELSGVGRVVGFLKTRGLVLPADITVDAVFDAAWSAGASPNLSNPAKRAFAKKVAAAYVREAERDARDGLTRPNT